MDPSDWILLLSVLCMGTLSSIISLTAACINATCSIMHFNGDICKARLYLRVNIVRQLLHMNLCVMFYSRTGRRYFSLEMKRCLSHSYSKHCGLRSSVSGPYQWMQVSFALVFLHFQFLCAWSISSPNDFATPPLSSPQTLQSTSALTQKHIWSDIDCCV